MKEIVTTSANYVAVIIGNGTLRAECEIGLVLSEPTYRPDHGGEIIKERKCETIRFSASPEILRKLSESFRQFADESEQSVSEALSKTLTGKESA